MYSIFIHVGFVLFPEIFSVNVRLEEVAAVKDYVHEKP